MNTQPLNHLERRIMQERIELLEKTLADVAKNGADKDIKIEALQAEINSLKTHLAMIMRDREFSVTPRIYN